MNKELSWLRPCASFLEGCFPQLRGETPLPLHCEPEAVHHIHGVFLRHVALIARSHGIFDLAAIQAVTKSACAELTEGSDSAWNPGRGPKLAHLNGIIKRVVREHLRIRPRKKARSTDRSSLARKYPRAHAPWHKTQFIRKLMPTLFAEKVAKGPPSKKMVLEKLFPIALSLATLVLAADEFPRNLSAEELASELINLFISGFMAKGFDPKRSAMGYLAGIIAILALGFDRKHRQRHNVSLDPAVTISDDRVKEPIEIVSLQELVALAEQMWPYLNRKRRDAIRAQIGPVFVKEEGLSRWEKNHLAKHRGLRQLLGMFEALGVEDL